jgi:hypothetical protein
MRLNDETRLWLALAFLCACAIPTEQPAELPPCRPYAAPLSEEASLRV